MEQKFEKLDCKIIFLTLQIPLNEISFFSQTYKKKKTNKEELLKK